MRAQWRIPFSATLLLTAVLVFLAPVRPAHAGAPVDGLAAFKAGLHAATAAKVDLRVYQTPVKDQDGFGTCFTYALVGTIEAAYKRRCAKHPALAATEPYCQRQLAPAPEDLDLSEWQLLNDMASQTSTRNPAASHESLSTNCGFIDYAWDSGDTWATHDAVIVAARGLRLAEEDAGNPWPSYWYLQALLGDAISLRATPFTAYGQKFCQPSPPVYNTNPWVDRFAYDPLNVAYDGRYGARYGVWGMQVVPASDTRKPASLEQYLANNYEVDLGISLANLHCDPATLYDGAALCITVAGPGTFGDVGHAMVLVGYDRNHRLFLLKNSWGPDNYPYIWVPYSFLKTRAGEGFIVRGVRPATANAGGHELGYLGTWAVFDSHAAYQGKLSLRRTRNTPDALLNYHDGFQVGPYITEDPRLLSTARLGTFTTRNNSPRRVWGRRVNTGQLRLYIESGAVGPGGDAAGTVFSGGSSWGLMTLDSADAAHDAVGKTYVRDFSGRAASTWNGTWDLILDGGPSTATLTLHAVGSIPTSDGRYRFDGTFADPISVDISGYADARGGQVHFAFLHPAVTRPPYNCVLTLAHERTELRGQVRDEILAGADSNLTCDGAGVVAVTGARR
ncbi:MAG TPA: hypothetical protein VI078_12590 [bacterium]